MLSDTSPKATLEDKVVWDKRAASNKLYRIQLAVLGDRWAGHRGPGSAGKPWGDVLRLPVDTNYLLDLRARALQDVSRPVEKPKRPRVKYLQRQDTTRKLTDASHEALITALQELDDEKLIDFSIISFSDGSSWETQVKVIAETDFLVSVHGNGLTHSLWMSPGKCKGVFELQPRVCSLVSSAGEAELMTERLQPPCDCSRRAALSCEWGGDVHTGQVRRSRVWG